MSEFKDRLKEAIGQELPTAFGKRCGFGPNIGRYLRGELNPGMNNLVIMADATNVSIEWLATGRGEKRKEPPPAVNSKSANDLNAKKAASELEQLKRWILNRQKTVERQMSVATGDKLARRSTRLILFNSATKVVSMFERRNKRRDE